MSTLLETKEEAKQRFRDRANDYWRKVANCDRFDVGKIPVPYGINGLRQFDCCESTIPFHALVTLYAKLGLHRYNMLQVKNLKFNGLKTFNMEMGACASTYYITLDAKDPSSNLHQTFQVLVAEECIGSLDLRCYIARPQEIEEPPLIGLDIKLVKLHLPDWPLSQNGFNDEKRFYLVKKSDLRDHDWIRLYLELAVCSESRLLKYDDLSKLEIVGVAIETNKEDVLEPRLNAKTANVYIRFKDLLGKDRLAIFRRIIDETTGHLSLAGDIMSEDKVSSSCLSLMDKKSSSSMMLLLRRRLGVHRLWRLSSPRRSHVYRKKHGLGSPVRRLPDSVY